MLLTGSFSDQLLAFNFEKSTALKSLFLWRSGKIEHQDQDEANWGKMSNEMRESHASQVLKCKCLLRSAPWSAKRRPNPKRWRRPSRKRPVVGRQRYFHLLSISFPFTFIMFISICFHWSLHVFSVRHEVYLHGHGQIHVDPFELIATWLVKCCSKWGKTIQNILNLTPSSEQSTSWRRTGWEMRLRAKISHLPGLPGANEINFHWIRDTGIPQCLQVCAG